MKENFASAAPKGKVRVDRPLVLVGLMGVGKSSIGKRLARALNLQFVDADEEIEKAADLTIPEIFEKFGEAHFRDGERRVIARLMEDRPMVIATGGGAFVDDETRRLILDRATAIWLDADIDTLVQRVGRRDNRPLLREGNPRQILRDLDAKRRPCYSEAQLHITSDNGPHETTVNAILEALKS